MILHDIVQVVYKAIYPWPALVQQKIVNSGAITNTLCICPRGHGHFGGRGVGGGGFPTVMQV